MNTAIIQARMGATRLPNKMLLHLHGYPVVEWVYLRAKEANSLAQIIFAIPNTAQDDVLAWYLESIGADVYRGSETDLVDRFYQAAKQYQTHNLVRICADNPLICASEIDRLIDFYNDNLCDYAYNHIPKKNRYPDGLGAEICSVDLLYEIHSKTSQPEHREHLFNYIWDNPTQYKIRTLEPPSELAYPQLKLDLDTLEDYKNLMEKPYRITMSASDIVNTALNG
jgi:spore coat polysaccharide biosynthesis protein SpsF